MSWTTRWIEPESVHRSGGEATQTDPGVVEVDGAVGQPQAGQVERDPAKAPGRKLGHDLAVQERGGRDAVHADHRLSVALVEHEAVHPGRGEASTCPLVLGDDVGCSHEAPS